MPTKVLVRGNSLNADSVDIIVLPLTIETPFPRLVAPPTIVIDQSMIKTFQW